MINLYGHGEIDQKLYQVLEYMPLNLSQLISWYRSKGAYKLKNVKVKNENYTVLEPADFETIKVWLNIVKNICSAMDYAHKEHNFVHRDLKPSNILIDLWGGP